MKKTLSLFFLFTTVQLMNCSSSDEPNPLGPGGDLTITSVTPETIYADDEITITGTGFDPDKSKNLVQMGSGTSPFIPFNKTFDSDPSFEVLSATATQLVVKAVEPQRINNEIYYGGEYPIQVTVNGKTALGSIKNTKRLMSFNINTSQVINRVIGCLDYIQPGDSLHIDGLGFYGNCSMFINNNKVPGAKATADNLIKVLIPKSFFGDLFNDCDEILATVKIVNGDGKSIEKNYHIVTSPPMVIFGAEFDKITYKKSEDVNANLTISGYSFYSTAWLRISSSGFVEEGPLVGAGGYPNQLVVPFTLGALQANKTYTVAIKEHQGDDYGFSLASFTLQP